MYFSKDFRRNQRRKLTALILKYINHYKFPHHVVEFVIKSFHFQYSFLPYFSLLLLPRTIFIIVFWISLFLFTLFVYLDGCVLSNVEYKLCKNKTKFINIIDPLLYVMGKEINTVNRYYYTLYYALVYFAGCIIKYVYIYSI